MNNRIKFKGKCGLYESELPFRIKVSNDENKRYAITRMLYAVNTGIQHEQNSLHLFEYYKDVLICDDKPYSLEESLKTSTNRWFSVNPTLTAKAFTILTNATNISLTRMPEFGTPVLTTEAFTILTDATNTDLTGTPEFGTLILAITIGFILGSTLTSQGKIPWTLIENEKLSDKEWKNRLNDNSEYQKVFMIEKEDI